ncbi:MAG: HAD family hydrolase, partial [Candidatus Xenobia bacterium]
MSLRPHWIRKRVGEIDFSALKRRFVLIDLDNTLARHGTWTPEADAVAVLEQARRDGVVQGICVVSNYVIGQSRLARVEHVAGLIGALAEGAPIWAAKPAARSFHRALEKLGASAGEAVMIGDQFFTD